MTKTNWLMSTIAAAGMVCATVARADTEVSYQGELRQGGELADGPFDMEFSLWDAAVGGNQVGSPVSLEDVAVVAGRFTAVIDFGAAAFDNTDRWLEVTVERVVLSPRQPITRAPYAIQTRGMVVGDDGNVVVNSLAAADGTITITSLGGIDLILDADTNNSGEDQNARLVMKQDGRQVVGRMGYREGANDLEIMQEYAADLILGTGDVDRLWIRSGGFVGVGRPDKITVPEVFGIHSPVFAGFGGMYVSTAGQDACPFYGYAAGGDSDAYHYYDGQTGRWHLYNDGLALTVTSLGSVGIGRDPVYRLDVESTSGVIRATMTSNSQNVAIDGITEGVSGGAGVRGVASSTGSGRVIGVQGLSYTERGIAVYAQTLHDTGDTIAVFGASDSPAGYDFYASGAGIDYGSSSSRRWKRNVETIDDPLAKLARLRGVYFDWDEAHGGHHDIGMIAEGVGEVLPEIVNYEENGVDAIGMDYSKLTPLLVEAVNALRAEVRAKDDELAALRARHEAEIAALARRIERLELRAAESASR